ncbi:MAG: hypothetical protein LLG05_09150 [Porphyromonadaceae bacterium]|nr:hypothetical protein [Porphyromonadaceae bacterium]
MEAFTTKKICDLQPLTFPWGIFVWQDTGFTGHNPDGVTVLMSTKKPKGKELTTNKNNKTKTSPLFV